jgi:hypothetical protein
MLRADWVTFHNLIKAVKPTVAQMPRGIISIDIDSLTTGYGYAYADGAHLPDIMGMRVVRLAALATGKYTYVSEGGTTIASN